MKIALFTYEFFPKYGGISHTTTSLCKTFRDEDHVLYIFNPHYQGNNIFNILDKSDSILKNLFFILKNKKLIILLFLSIRKIFSDKEISFSDRIKMINFLFIPKYFTKFTKNITEVFPYFKKHNFDIIFGAATGGFTLPLIFALSRIFNKKVVSLSHGDDFLSKKFISFRASYIKNLDKIILSNKRMKYLIKKIHGLSENKLAVINRGIIIKDYEVKESKQELRKQFNVSENDFILISVGNHVPRKKFDLVIEAIDKIKKNQPAIPINYFLIGNGPFTPKLKKITKELKLEKSVKFLGELNYDIRNKYYKLSDLFLMPSISEKGSIEGFGISFLEANYFTLPVIGTNTGGIVEAIIDGKTGLLVKPNDLNDLVEKILFLYENPKIRIKLGEEGNKRVINDYCWEKIIKKYIKNFKNVLDMKYT